MDATKIILGAISIIIGLVMLPLIAGFIEIAKSNHTLVNISGISALVDIIAYSFCFGLLGVGIGMIAIGFKGKD